MKTWTSIHMFNRPLERKLIEKGNFGLKTYLSAEVKILDEESNSPVDIEVHKDIFIMSL